MSRPKLVPQPAPMVYAPADDIRAAGAHPNPSHAAKWQAAVKWLRRGKVSRWLADQNHERLTPL